MFIILVDLFSETVLYLATDVFSYYFIVLQHLFNIENGRLLWFLILYFYCLSYKLFNLTFGFTLFICIAVGFNLNTDFSSFTYEQSAELYLLAPLLNGYMLIHPIFLYTSILLTFFFFLYWLQTCFIYKFENLNLIYFWINAKNTTTFVLSLFFFALTTGSLWAVQELGWSGLWAWDFVELVPLLMFFCCIFFLHCASLIKASGVGVYVFLLFTFFLFLAYIQLNPDSTHNFFGGFVISELQENLVAVYGELGVKFPDFFVVGTLIDKTINLDFDTHFFFVINGIYILFAILRFVLYLIHFVNTQTFFYRYLLLFFHFLLLIIFFLPVFYSFFFSLLKISVTPFFFSYTKVFFIFLIYFRASSTSVIYLIVALFSWNVYLFMFIYFIYSRRLQNFFSRLIHVLFSFFFVYLYTGFTSFFEFQPESYYANEKPILLSMHTTFWLLTYNLYTCNDILNSYSILFQFFFNFFFFNFFDENLNAVSFTFFKICSLTNFNLFTYLDTNSLRAINYMFLYNSGSYIWNFLFFVFIFFVIKNLASLNRLKIKN